MHHRAVFNAKSSKYAPVCTSCFACRSALGMMPTGGIHWQACNSGHPLFTTWLHKSRIWPMLWQASQQLLVTHACSLVPRTYTVPIKTDSFLRIISQYHCTWIQDWCQCYLCLAATFIFVLLLLSPWLVLLVLKLSAICRGPMCISAGRRL